MAGKLSRRRLEDQLIGGIPAAAVEAFTAEAAGDARLAAPVGGREAAAGAAGDPAGRPGRHRVAMAVATDCNPGTSPVASMTAAINLACVQFRLTPEEALAGATRIAARALGLEADVGTLEAGKAADLAVWDIERPAELAYWLGKPLLAKRMVAGVWDA